MRQLLIGASAFALLAACGADNEPKAKNDAAAEKSSVAQKFNAKDYGQTAAVLAALKLDGESNSKIKFEDSSVNKGSAVFKGVSIGSAADNSQNFLAKTMTFDGLNMDGDSPSFDRLVLSDVSMVDAEEGVNFNIGDITIVEPNATAAKFFTALIQGEEPTDTGSIKDWAFDNMSMSNLTLAASPKDEEGAVSISIGNLSMTNLIDAVVGKSNFSDLKVDFDIPDAGDFPIKGSLKLDNISMANVQAAVFDAFAEAGSDVEKLAEMNKTLLGNQTSPIDQGFDESKIEGLRLDLSGLSFSMPKSETKLVRNKDGVATSLDSSKTVFKLSADAEGGQLGAQLSQALGMLDYKDLEFSVQSKASYNPSTQETKYTDYVLDMKDGFSLSFNAGAFNVLDAIKGMSESDESGQPNMDVFNNIKLSGLEFSLQDKSLMDRAFKVAASMQGMEPAQLKSMASGMLAMGTMQASNSGADMKIVNETVSALSSFIENSGTLTIKLAPKAPISMSDFDDTSKITAEALGFSATAK